MGRGLQPRSKRLRDMASIKRCGRGECPVWLGLLLAANGVWPTVAPVWTNAQFLDGSTIKENTFGLKIAASSLGLLSSVLQQIGNQRWQHITFSYYLSIRISCSSSWRRWSAPTQNRAIQFLNTLNITAFKHISRFFTPVLWRRWMTAFVKTQGQLWVDSATWWMAGIGKRKIIAEWRQRVVTGQPR